MKKLSFHFFHLLMPVFLLAIFCFSFAARSLTADATTPSPIYGVLGENAVLLSSSLEPITGLPATYFVIITGDNDTHYEVFYSDLTGFIEKSAVTRVGFEPKIKYGAALFTAQNDTHPVIIRDAPKSNGVPLGSIPDGEQALYYGAVTGDALIPAAGGKWYYVKHGAVYGYVYSAQGVAQNFAINTGEKVEPPPEETPDKPSELGGLPDWVFILLLTVPAVIIMLALFGRAKSPQV